MGEKVGSPVFHLGGEEVRRLLKKIEARYSDAFAEIGPGALQHFKHIIDNVDTFLDLLADPETSLLVKLMDYAKIRGDVSEF